MPKNVPIQPKWSGTSSRAIAQASGVTERTFFRYFADKREVIFAGQDVFQRGFTDGVAAAEDAEPMDIVASAIASAADFFDNGRLDFSRRRHRVIVANAELQERELLKMAALSTAIAEALEKRGVPEPAATLSAQSGVTVFRQSFAQWIAEGNERPLADISRDVFAHLRSLTAGTAS